MLLSFATAVVMGALKSIREAARRPQWRTWASYSFPFALLLGAAAFIRAHGRIPYLDAAYLQADHYKYLAMAIHPLSDDPLVHQAPFCWRVLTPWLVHALPTPPLEGFWLVTVAGLAGAVAGTMWFLRALGLSRFSVVAGGVAFVLLPQATVFTLWDYLLVDPVAFALQALAFACAVSRRGGWLLIALTLYAFEKETVLFAALFALLYALERRDWHMARWSVAGMVASGVVLLCLHLAIHADQSYTLFEQFQLVNAIYARAPLYRVIDTFGGSWILLLPAAALQMIHPPRLFTRPSFLLVFLAATAQVLIAVNSGRVVIYAFPVIIAAVAFEIEHLAGKSLMTRGLLWTTIFVAQVPWVIQNTSLASVTLFDEITPDLFMIEMLVCVVTAAIVFWAGYRTMWRWLHRTSTWQAGG